MPKFIIGSVAKTWTPVRKYGIFLKETGLLVTKPVPSYYNYFTGIRKPILILDLSF
ncbi:MAG: hypothetical protein JWQ66_3548 [Mucilaginibacter sp.]|nr:hypothetical protein [Mucilaginibacter sp.]